MKRFLLLGFSLILVACSSNQSGSNPDSQSQPSGVLKGGLTIRELGNYVPTEADVKGGCLPGPDYDDIRSGLSVVVRDGSDNIIGTGRLGEAIKVRALQEFSPEDRAKYDREFTDGNGVLIYCQYPFQVSGLPESQVYQLEIPGATNGSTLYTKDELDQVGWQVEVSIGEL